MLRDIYADEYAARDPAAQQAFARKLLLDANRTNDDPMARFVMYQESVRLALDLGDVTTVDNGLRATAYNFDVDEHDLWLTSFKQLVAKIRRRPEAHSDYDRILNRKISAALQANEFPAAMAYASLNESAMRRFGNSSFLRQAIATRDRIDSLSDRFMELEPVRVALENSGNSYATPELTAAHREFGIFLALEKGDYALGCEHLLQSNDAQLIDLAGQELQDPVVAEEQLALADLWWDISHAHESADAGRARAQHWYEQALPHLTGLSKKRALVSNREERNSASLFPMNSPKKLLVTGGAGFIGSNLVRYLVQQKCQVLVIDKLTYAGNLVIIGSRATSRKRQYRSCRHL